MKRHLAFTSLAITGMLVVSACGSDDSTADQVSELCTDIATLQTEIDQVAGESFDPATTTANSVQAQLDTLQTDLQAVTSEASDVSSSVKTSLTDAVTAYKAALQAIPSGGDTTLEAAGQEVVTAKENLATSWQATVSELNCPPTTT